MCSPAVLTFVASALSAEEVKNKRVLEVGSYDVNGTVRPYVEALEPAQYAGIDLIAGPGVDYLVAAENIHQLFPPESIDIVISTEMLEHVKDWRASMFAMMNVLVSNGLLIITTRSPGFGYHAYPDDYWRYSVNDMQRILEKANMRIVLLESDPVEPGVFLKAQKPVNWDAFGSITEVWREIELEVPLATV